MDLHVFHEVVVPLVGMEDTVVIMISTPVDSFNFFTKLILAKDKQGLSLFLVADMVLSCDRCINSGRTIHCTHRLKFLPPWKSKDKQDVMEMILKDQQTIMARENFGVISDEGGAIVERKFLEKWVDARRYIPEDHERALAVVVAVDPNGSNASTASEMAIVTTALLYGIRVVSFYTPTVAMYSVYAPLEKASIVWPAKYLSTSPPSLFRKKYATSGRRSGLNSSIRACTSGKSCDTRKRNPNTVT